MNIEFQNNTTYGGAITLFIFVRLIKTFFLNLFLAFTTVFPFVLMLNYIGTPLQSAEFLKNYQKVLSFLIGFMSKKTLDNVGTGELITLFFVVIFVISIIISGVKYILKKYTRITFNIKLIHIIIFMTVVYSIATFITYLKDPENLGFMLILTFYLFNMLSIFATNKIDEGMDKLREKYPKLAKLPF